jgi:hypothetical protein
MHVSGSDMGNIGHVAMKCLAYFYMKIVDKSTIKSSFLAVEITGRYNPAVRVS